MNARLAYSPAHNSDNHTPSCQQNLPPRSSGGIILSGSDRYNSFGPSEQLNALHSANENAGNSRKGVVSFALKNATWREWKVDLAEAAQQAKARIDRDVVNDFYVSQQSFLNWRSISQLRVLGCAYIDIDYRVIERWKRQSPRDVLIAVLDFLEENAIPAPSYVLDTGRGLNLVWLHDAMPRAALPRWSAVQKQLATTLKVFGADPKALDAARVFRVVGSVNSKADQDRRVVGMIWCQGEPSNPYRYIFDDLANEVLPLKRSELVSLRAERAKRRANGYNAARPAKCLDTASWGEACLTDLQRLREFRHGSDSLPEGQRDNWLFCAAVAMAWICPPEVMKREIQVLALEAAGWRDKETASRMSSVLKRTFTAAAGDKISFNGHEVDPRYRMKSSTIIEWLEIDPPEMRDANLRMLIDQDRKRELNTERTKKSRQVRGAASRSEVQAKRLELGQKALYLAASKGMNREELADHFKVSTGQISKAMAEARKA
ncbi:hypothetical protein [Brucella pituitosa]|uniref:hypothetical protein n=1 Tax=Brucella pituitosa TaxID=571256 RepID=UPI003F4A9602